MVDRIKLILKVNNITASRFADEIGVQRSSISHIVSGRNQPSLDLIQKILKRFPEINSEWLLNGNGSMLRNPQPDLFNITETADEKPYEEIQNDANEEIKLPKDISESIDEQLFEEKIEQFKPMENVINNAKPELNPEFLKEKGLNIKPEKSITDHSIEKIVIFYNDKTFREYYPESE